MIQFILLQMSRVNSYIQLNNISLYFFLRFIYLLESQIYRKERQRERSSDRWFTPQVSTTGRCYADPKPGASSVSPTPGLPPGCRFPKLWAVLDCFPGPQAGSWKGSGTAGIEPAPIWDPGRAIKPFANAIDDFNSYLVPPWCACLRKPTHMAGVDHALEH